MTTRWLTFDCYGTLVDWEKGMTEALRSVSSQWAALLGAYHVQEPGVQKASPAATYREVMAETLRRAAAETSIVLAPGDDDVLGRTLPSWPVFPDTNSALRALHDRGYRIGVLSNVDRDHIEETYRQFAVSPDLTITSLEVGSYKPELGHFRAFQEKSGAGADQWIHVACSVFHDVEPARELGVPTVYIDRGQHRNGVTTPTVTLSDLTGLPDAAASLFAGTV